jgi:hypothetical protein
MKRVTAAVVFAGLCLPGVSLPSCAFAHGASRLKLTESVEINAPAAKVWKLIGNFQDMSWLPGVVKTTGSGGNDPSKAKRELTLQSGATIDESLDKYDAASMTYSYFMDKVDLKVLPVSDYSATLVVTPDGAKSRVVWRAAFFRGDQNFNPPPALNDDAATKAVEAIYKPGLAALKKKAEAPEATN